MVEGRDARELTRWTIHGERAVEEETTDILSDPETVAAIGRGLDELNAGERYTLEEVRKELGL